MDIKFKKIASILLIINHLLVSIGLPLYASAAQAESGIAALGDTLAELKMEVNNLPGRMSTEHRPATAQTERVISSRPEQSLSSPLFSASPVFRSSAALGTFIPAEESKQTDKNDLLSQLPSLEGSRNSLTEEKSLLLNRDMQRSREADENDLRPLEGVKKFWQVMGSDSRSQAATGIITGIANDMASNALRDWMGQSGNLRLQFNSSGEASADLLLPLLDTPRTLLFNQQGIRVNKERTTVNVGLGIRHYVSDHFMLGVNSFYDRDITGNNARFSVGAEAWTHFLKLSANKYQRLTDWRQSPLPAMEDYDERPANGFDLAADAWLPFYPQFGASVKYEKYFGKGVILDNSASPGGLQNSPSAVTTTLNYTPIPLLTFKAGHKSGSGSDSFVGMDINYRLGLSWEEQTDRETVRVMRSLPGARYDFVDRNYNIVMQYRKQNLISLSLPSSVTAEAASTTVITASVRAKYGLKKIDWRAGELLAAGGALIADSATSVAVRLPKYHHEGVNSYTVSAIATDNHGNESPESTVVITLIPSSTIVTLEVKPADNVVANGIDLVHLHARVTGKTGELLSDHNVRFVVSGIKDGCILKGANSCETLHITDTSGMAIVPLASTRAGKVTLFSHLDNGNRDRKTLNFIADRSTAELAELNIVANNAVANGKVANKANVVVADFYGNPISNAAVTFSVAGAASLSTTATVTDDNGSATVDLTSKLAGNVTLTASAAGMEKRAVLTFVADTRTAKIDDLMATPAKELKANGRDTSVLVARVKDANGNLVSGANVRFSATGGAKLSQQTVTTNGEGLASVNVTNTRAGTSTVTAVTAEDKIGKQVAISFIGDISTAQINRLTATPASGVKADGSDAAELKAVVLDAQGNTVSGVMVTFTVSGNARLNQSTALSGNDGIAAVSLTSSSASSSTVTAVTPFDPIGKQATVGFAADVTTASIASLIATPSTEVKANGIATSALSAQVKDTNGNLVSGAQVNFSVIGKGRLSQPFAITSKEGIASVQLTSTLAEVSTVTAITDFDGTGKQATVSFIADATTAKIFSLTASRTSEVKANGVDSSNLTALVKDNYGNAVGGVMVTFRVEGKANLSSFTAKTADDGTATVALSSKFAEVSTVTAVAEQDATGKQASVSFMADVSTAQIDSFTASRSAEVLANGTDLSVLTATVRDAHGNLVNDAQVLFSVTGKGKVSQLSGKSIKGIVTVQLTSTTAESSTVRATTAFDTTGKQVSVSFIADSATAKIDSLIASRTSDVKANGSDSSQLTATVKDAHGNLISGAKVFFSVKGKGQLSQTSATTVKGIASTQLTSVSAESLTVTAISNIDNTGKQATVSFIADIATAKIDSLSASRTSDVKANGNDYSVLSATVKDTQGNLVSGATVFFSVSTGTGKLSEASAISFEGIASVQLTNVNAASTVVKATTDVDRTGKQATVSFIADLATAKIDSVTASRAAGVKANGIDPSVMTVTVKDSNGNLVNGAKVFFSVQGKGEVSQPSASTLDGIAKVNLTSRSAEISTVIAVTDFDKTGKQASVSFVADIATAKIDSLAASRVSGITADGIDSSVLRTKVTDANGNPTANAKVFFSVNGHASLSSLSATVAANGIAEVKLTSLIATSSTVTAVTEADTTGKSASVSFQADVSTATVESLTAFPATALANGQSASKLQAVIKDANGNPVEGALVTFSATGSAQLKPSSALTNSDGIISVQLTKITAGNSTVTAKTAFDKSGKQTTVTFVADAETAGIASLNAGSPYWDKTTGLATSEVSVLVKDANGNEVSNEEVTLRVSGNATIKSTIRTAANGYARLPVTTTTAEEVTVTAATAYDTSGKQTSVTFTANPLTGRVASLTASRRDNVKADGKDSSLITATVTDLHGNLLHDVVTTFVEKPLSAKTKNLSQKEVRTVKGIATVTLTSTNASSITVSSSYGDTPNKDVSVSFIADKATAKVDSLTASRTSEVTANGRDYSLLTATVKDANGNLVNDAKVLFKVITGKGELSQASANSVNGVASVQLSSLIAATSTVTASTDVDKTVKQASVSFMADPATAQIATLTASRTSGVIANGADRSVLSATVKDANGNPVNGATVLFKVTTGTGILKKVSASNINGVATVNLTNTRANTTTVSASTEVDTIGKQVSVSFMADVATATITSFTASRSSEVKANGSDSSVLKVSVIDAFGNPVDKAKIIFSVKGKASLSSLSATTDNDGFASVNLTSLTADSSTVTAVTDYDKKGKQVAVSFMADQATATLDSLTASPQDGTKANGTDVSVITATIRDANGNLVNGVRVAFFVKGNASLSALSAITNSEGKVSVNLTSLSADSSTVTAQTAFDTKGKQVSVSFIADRATATIDSFTASPITGVLTDGTSFSTLTATVKDAKGNLLGGTEVNFILTGNATLSQSSAVTSAEGKVVVTLSSKLAGNNMINAVTEYDTTGKKAFVTFIANKSTAKVTNITALPANSLPANGKALSTITAMVQDANGNPVNDVEVMFSVNGKARLNQPTARTNSNGFATVTLTSTAAGSNAITARTDIVKDTQTVTVNFIADISTASIASLTATPAEGIPANGQAVSALRALVKDENDNPVMGAEVTFNISNGNQSVALTDPTGIAFVEFNSVVAGKITVKATLEKSDRVGKTAEVIFIGDVKTAAIASVTASPAAGITADGKSLSTLTAVVKDAKGNLVKEATVNFKVAGSAKLSGTTAKTDANGNAAVTLTSTLEGSNTLTATTDLDKTGKSVVVSFVAGAISASTSTLQLSSPIFPADAKSTLTLTLTAKDQFGNKSQGAKVLFKIANLEGAKISAVTEKDGVYSATLTSGNKATLGSITVLQNDVLVKDLRVDVGQYSPQLTLVIN